VHEPLEVEAKGYEEQPMKIGCLKVKQLCNKVIPLVKVIWTHHESFEDTWETKDEIKLITLICFKGMFSIDLRTKLLEGV